MDLCAAARICSVIVFTLLLMSSASVFGVDLKYLPVQFLEVSAVCFARWVHGQSPLAGFQLFVCSLLDVFWGKGSNNRMACCLVVNEDEPVICHPVLNFLARLGCSGL